MSEFDLKQEPDKANEITIKEERSRQRTSPRKETLKNAVETLREMVETPTLTPDQVKDVLTQIVYTFQDVILRIEYLESDIHSLRGEFELYANQSLNIQNKQLDVVTKHKERVAQTLTVLDGVLRTL